MSDSKSAVLPYRVDGPDLTRFLVARARGRDNTQVQAALDLSPKAFEGTLSAATALGFLDTTSGTLSELGRQFALAASDDARRALVIKGFLSFEPYELLLEAIRQRSESITTLDWIETWWNTHGYGSSGSNRTEGSSAFGRLAAFAGMGAYIQGRRGHPSRIEWFDGALEAAGSEQVQDTPPSPTGATPRDQSGPTSSATSIAPSSMQVGADTISLNLPLGAGRVVEIRLPSRMNATEKDRLLQLLAVLIPANADADNGGTTE